MRRKLKSDPDQMLSVVTNLGRRELNRLAESGVRTVNDLSRAWCDGTKFRRIGQKSLVELKRVLEDRKIHPQFKFPS